MSHSNPLFRRISDLMYQVGPARYYQPAYAQIAQAIGLDDGVFLDVGCGPGWLCVHVGSGKPQVDAIGLDTSEQMVAHARRNKGPRLNVTIRKMDAMDIKFPEATFDVAAAVQSAHHWEDTNRVLSEVHRVLKPGGRFLIYEAERGRTDVPPGWVEKKRGWPPDRVVTTGWKRFGMDDAEWAGLEVAVRAIGFSNVVCDIHGFYRRMTLTK
jgi:SAM-dependent methyltransferase